jgi:alpha-L-fucosidase
VTLYPAEGQAVKEFYFTSKDDTVYAISPDWPKTDNVTLEGVLNSNVKKVELLGSEVPVKWNRKGNDLQIDLSNVSPRDLPKPGIMYTWKITRTKGH